ncbi:MULTISPECIES: type I pullulanase [unclassified Fusibacter]|uniref:type I pullulanase n=1 Tax=unclassified Fusibacter TaxID=2624464 RepID=UPI0010118031|nr:MULTISPECIES: type I pullulanase [unclassified Fusibacter]MCK8061434.1 type I pullulanase [Fusibacter sp. A2]NPE23621.1 type I pullulanase [Fusibacter sp. A1]RXV58894.1 type I pullulanase [Fusibacter sp. A1]
MSTYQSKKFGYRYEKTNTRFRVYASKCEAVNILLYSNAHSYRHKSLAMEAVGDNEWELTVDGDLHNTYYMYQVVRGKNRFIATDPFGYASSANSKRSVVIDLAMTEVEGFEQDEFVKVSMQEAVLYEMHIRDFTMDPNLKLKHPGKYLGVVEKVDHLPYGIDYLKDLGITHVHFLPLQDFLSIDESDPTAYNWGYDPEQYFVPEGSYSTDPEDPLCRIRELKTMVKKLHDNGLAVVLDVVYNHTYRGGENPLAVLAPFTYYRHLSDGSYSNGSGCGNELKTEHAMTRQLIIDSMIYWMNTFHIDGFRFDLMGLMDVETAKMIEKEVRSINPNAILYGEPWTGGGTILPGEKMMVKGKQRDLSIAFFNDDYRSALKGDSDGKDHGFIQGYKAKMHDVKTGLLGSIHFSEHHVGFAKEPWESVNYVSAHDNLILYDKLKYSTMWDDDKVKKATKMSFSLILLAFGIPFIQSGTEFMRTKHMDHNSYRSSDAVNAMDWGMVNCHQDLYQHVKTLIAIRKNLRCFEEFNEKDIRERVVLQHTKNVVAYRITLRNHAFKNALIVINPNHHEHLSRLVLRRECRIVYDGQTFDPDGLAIDKYLQGRRIKLEPFQTLVVWSNHHSHSTFKF